MDKSQIIQIKTSCGIRFLKSSCIVSIQTTKRHSTIFLKDETILEAYHTLRWFDKILPRPDFCRCHSSYIIHCKYIIGLDFTRSKVRLNGYQDINYSRKYKDCLIENLKEFVEQN